MANFLKMAFLTLTLSATACPDGYALTGIWRGDLRLGNMSLPLVFNFSEKDGDVTECTMDSPAQGATGIPVSVALCTSDSISLECSAIGANYTGRISKDMISGTFSQRGMSFPLILKEEPSAEDRRPQTPKPPFPYTVIDTLFTSTDGSLLSATLTLPATPSGNNVPAIVMVTGSGPQNRDEELFGHKPFAVIADYLGRHGVASLRYDDRGTGKSTGNFADATTYTLKEDARNGIAFMRSIKGIGKTGILGHSEGGTIAFMLGADDVPDFIVSLAGMAIPGRDLLLAQNSRMLDNGAVSGKDKENSMALIGRYFDIIAGQASEGVSRPVDLESIAAASEPVPPAVLSSLKSAERSRSRWFDTFLTLNPAESLSKIKCPVLAVNGDRDTQVEAGPNLAAIERENKTAQLKKMPGLNHMMQHADTGDISEYEQIRETISPEVLELILQFIRQQQ